MLQRPHHTVRRSNNDEPWLFIQIYQVLNYFLVCSRNVNLKYIDKTLKTHTCKLYKFSFLASVGVDIKFQKYLPSDRNPFMQYTSDTKGKRTTNTSVQEPIEQYERL